MSEPLATVLSALRSAGSEPRKHGKDWSACCPAHDDRHPSLSIGVGTDGRALVTCHAGCATDEVLDALGLQMKDLMPERHRVVSGAPRRQRQARKTTPGTEEIFASADEAVTALERTLGPCSRRWVYTDAAGTPVGETVRWDLPNGEKQIRPVCRRGDRWAIGAMARPRPLLGLPELAALPDGAWVCIVEGEKAADAARAIGLAATTSAGGSKAAAMSDWDVFKNKVAVILADRDDAGEAYADEVAVLCHRAGADEVRIARLAEHWADLPAGGDIADALAIEHGDTALIHEAVMKLVGTTPPEQAREDAASPRFTPFPVDTLPEPARSYVRTGAEAIGCDPSFIVLPLLAGLAGAIGNSRCITLKRGWSEPAIIWAAIVGESGTTKTPSLRYALRPIYDRQHRLMRDHEQEESRWQAEQTLHEAELTKWKRDAARGKTTAEPPPAPVQPICPRVWIEDTTTEALASLLQDNPRGLLAIYNELSGWFSFGRYSNGNGAGEIARWLEMFDAGQVMIDRKTTGRVYVPRASVSIAGAIQPRILERSVGELHRENGLLARLLIAYPPRRAKRWTETEADPRLDAQMAAVFDRLYDLEPDLDTDGEPVPRALPLSADAKGAWVRYVIEHADRLQEHVGDEAAALNKLEAYAARMALVIHCVRAAASDPTLDDPATIDRKSIEAGVLLARWFRAETLRVYAMLRESEEVSGARKLADLVTAQGGSVTIRQWQRLRSCPTAKDAEGQLDSLVTAGLGEWSCPPPGSRGGRHSKSLVLLGAVRTSDTTPAADPRNPPQGPQSGVVSVLSVSEPGVPAHEPPGSGPPIHDQSGNSTKSPDIPCTAAKSRPQ